MQIKYFDNEIDTIKKINIVIKIVNIFRLKFAENVIKLKYMIYQYIYNRMITKNYV